MQELKEKIISAIFEVIPPCSARMRAAIEKKIEKIFLEELYYG